jgi:serine/threonine-protein kinase
MANQGETSERNPLRVGQILLDRYEVTDRLEAGGTSVVYVATDLRLSRPVCIKVFHHLTHREGIYRATYEHFIQEAFALSKLTHPNTLRIYDFGHLDRAPGKPPFQVCEYMSGGTLADLVRKTGPLTAPETADLVFALSGALAEAHQVGIIHRDIKPRNILFNSAGGVRSPKLADFGIAKSLEMTHNQLTHQAGDTQIVAGGKVLLFSPHWAAPEQLVAEPVDTSTDIYSLALLACYALTGKCPFTEEAAREGFLERQHGPRRMVDLLSRSGLAPGAIELLASAVRVDQQERPRNIDEFGMAFSREVTAPPAAEPTPSIGEISSTTTKQPLQSPSGPPVVLTPTPAPIYFENRTTHFVAITGATADLQSGAARFRVTLMPVDSGKFSVHVKGLYCFIRKQGGRATMATQFAQSESVDLLEKDQRLICRFDLLFGTVANEHSMFAIGSRYVALGTRECNHIVALDFGSGSDLFFIYTPEIRSEHSPGRTLEMGNQRG